MLSASYSERLRQGVVANLEYRPSDDLQLYWRNLWNEFRDTEQRQQAIIDYRNGDLLGKTATSGTFTEAAGERLVKYRREDQSIFNSTIGGEYKYGRSTLSGSIGVGRASCAGREVRFPTQGCRIWQAEAVIR